MIIRSSILLCCSLISSLLSAQDLPPYNPVTAERLLNPEESNWLMYRGSYDSHGYSSLDEINTDNVDGLVPVWSFSTGLRGASGATYSERRLYVRHYPAESYPGNQRAHR